MSNQMSIKWSGTQSKSPKKIERSSKKRFTPKPFLTFLGGSAALSREEARSLAAPLAGMAAAGLAAMGISKQ